MEYGIYFVSMDTINCRKKKNLVGPEFLLLEKEARTTK
jgi:hypothetical protein